jgi:GntR family transcriptional repressor for pyruvate dehydrogenase complex
MASTRPGPRSAAGDVAARLREQILDGDAGETFLGSENQLLARLGVSRPTLRQAARILEQEGLLAVRRGVGGGLYGRHPTPEAVTHVSSVYLRSQHTDIRDLTRSVALIAPELARLAALNPAVAERATLLRFVEDYEERGRDDEERWFHLVGIQFGHRLAALSGSPSLTLFQQVLLELALAPLGVRVFADRRRISLTRRHHRQLAIAVREGDADAAHAMTSDFYRRVARWIQDTPAPANLSPADVV